MDEQVSTRAAGRRKLPVLRLAGVPIRFHFTFVVLAVSLVIGGFAGSEPVAFYALYIFGLLASVLLHEVGHAVVSRRYGIRTKEIILFPIGGVSRFERNPQAREELWIALAGPFVNLVLAAALVGYLAWQHQLINWKHLPMHSEADLFERLAIGNIALAVLNLVPTFPMDGGRALRSLLSRFRPEDDATRLVALAGRLLALVMALYGLVGMAIFGYPAWHCLLIFVAVFIYVGAAQEGNVALSRKLSQGIPVRAAMLTDYRTLSHGHTVRDAAQLMLATAQQDFPVVHGDRVIGLLDRRRLLRAMNRYGLDAYVAGVMDRNYPLVSPDTDLASLVPAITRSGACALVMDGETLLGLLTSENMSQFLTLRRSGFRLEELRAGA